MSKPDPQLRSDKAGPIPGRNILGQKSRPKLLSALQKQDLCARIEAAMNDPRYDEARVYWNETGVWCAGVRIDRGKRLAKT